jgi:hypothetical protein
MELNHRDAVLWTLLVTFFTLLIEEHESSGFFPVRFGFEHILCHRFPLRSSLSSVAFSLSFVARTNGQSRHCRAGGRKKKNPWFFFPFCYESSTKELYVDPGWSGLICKFLPRGCAAFTFFLTTSETFSAPDSMWPRRGCGSLGTWPSWTTKNSGKPRPSFDATWHIVLTCLDI